jgi:hypothetical protein
MRFVLIVAALCVGACQGPQQQSAAQRLQAAERKQALDHATADCAKQGKKPASEAEAPNAPIAGMIMFSSGAEATWRCV